MKKIALGILADNPEENAVFMTEDGQGFFDPIKANNHANKNELSEPEAFYREGCEPEDVRALEEQLGFAQEENETLTDVLTQIEQAVDFTKEAPEVTQESDALVAAVVQLREKHEGAIALIDKVIHALTDDEAVVDEKAEPVIVEIMKLRVSLLSAQAEKETLVNSLSIVQSELDTLKANPIAVVEELVVEPAAKTPAKNGK
jgi:chromosome segregation ATPase